MPCECHDVKACFHESCIPRKQLARGQWIIENAYGHIRLADPDELITNLDNSVTVRRK